VSRGLYYQNPFVIWFNHHHQPDYRGPEIEIKDDSIVIGGGLASLDVVKILMLETVGHALRKRGIPADLFEMEKKGIDKMLAANHLTMQDLGLKGCTLYYRRRAIDMPLTPMSTVTSQHLAKAQLVRQKILDNFQKKYLFHFVPCCIPVGKKTKDDRLTGITFQKTIVEKDRVIPIPGQYLEVETPLAVSSIGSIPERIEGVPAKSGVFSIPDPTNCLIEGFDHVFAIGNAVTGKGNINESVKHSREISSGIIDHFFEWQQQEYQDWHRQTADKVDLDMDRIITRIEKRPSLSEVTLQSILQKTSMMQEKTGYDGNYESWIKKNLPLRYEDLINPDDPGEQAK
jgi:hypothetical protein